MNQKPTKQQLATAGSASVYADGTVILYHEKSDKDAGCVTWATVWKLENTVFLGYQAQENGTYVAFSNEAIAVIWDLSRLEIYRDNSSEALRKEGLTQDTITLALKSGARLRVSTVKKGCSALTYESIRVEELGKRSPSFEDINETGYVFGHIRCANAAYWK